MDQNTESRIFRLPRYNEIPNVGLYLEQTTRYIIECFEPLMDGAITGSMISNYVKRGLVSNPVKKQYSREQIACLIYITAVKTVLSMEDIRVMLALQKEGYDVKAAYDYFCIVLEEMLCSVAEGKKMPDLAEEASEAQAMLHSTIVAVAHTICLRKRFAALQQDEKMQKPANV